MGLRRRLICLPKDNLGVTGIEGRRTKCATKATAFSTEKTINPASHPWEPAANEAIGTPSTIPAPKPVKTIETARDDLLDSTDAAATDIATDQKTGWTKAGRILVSSKRSKFGAKAEAIFEMKNTNRTKHRLTFLFTFENSKAIHGPRSAITKAKLLKSHPARSIVMPKASDTCGRIPTTPSSGVIKANAPAAAT